MRVPLIGKLIDLLVGARGEHLIPTLASNDGPIISPPAHQETYSHQRNPRGAHFHQRTCVNRRHHGTCFACGCTYREDVFCRNRSCPIFMADVDEIKEYIQLRRWCGKLHAASQMRLRRRVRAAGLYV